jgi:hypothetical protein
MYVLTSRPAMVKWRLVPGNSTLLPVTVAVIMVFHLYCCMYVHEKGRRVVIYIIFSMSRVARSVYIHIMWLQDEAVVAISGDV